MHLEEVLLVVDEDGTATEQRPNQRLISLHMATPANLISAITLLLAISLIAYVCCPGEGGGGTAGGRAGGGAEGGNAGHVLLIVPTATPRWVHSPSAGRLNPQPRSSVMLRPQSGVPA